MSALANTMSKMGLNTLEKASGSSSSARQVPMTEEQIKKLGEGLKAKNRMNVFANRFDINRPFRVQVRVGSTWHQYGNFTEINAAAMIGTICSKGHFGDKAKAGEFDAEKAQAHPEFIAWMADERNAEIISKAMGGAEQEQEEEDIPFLLEDAENELPMAF